MKGENDKNEEEKNQQTYSWATDTCSLSITTDERNREESVTV